MKIKRMKIKRLTLTSLSICAASLLVQQVAVSAEVYRWVDPEGRTHYSQSWPGGGQRVRTIEVEDYYSPPSPVYLQDMDRIQQLTRQLAAERQALEETREESQLLSQGISVEQSDSIELSYPLYPTYPVHNIMVAD
jgi:hypothetical protein